MIKKRARYGPRVGGNGGDLKETWQRVRDRRASELPCSDLNRAKTKNRRHYSLDSNATVALLPVLACFLGGATQKWEEGLVITFSRCAC